MPKEPPYKDSQPHVPKGLMEWLTEFYPPVVLHERVELGDRELWIAAGERKLVGVLKTFYATQTH